MNEGENYNSDTNKIDNSTEKTLRRITAFIFGQQIEWMSSMAL